VGLARFPGGRRPAGDAGEVERMARVVLKNLTKRFRSVVAVEDLSLEIEDKEFLVLVGPSGCGKTTALRCIAGLEEASTGEIYIEDRLVNDVSPKDRDIAMVFQNYALYPHMNVYDNMAFGLKLRKFPRPEIQRRVNEAAGMLGLQALLDRKPRELSGGQRQRVALGRAIVREPKVFLMDEPLSNLDAKLRVQTRAELIKLHRRLGITTIYVTHDQTEAMTMGDRIAVLNEGKMQQVDAPLELFNRPANVFVAGFIGSPAMNFLPATLESSNGDLFVKTEELRLRLPPGHGERVRDRVGRSIIFGVRPDDIYDRRLASGVASPEVATLPVDVTEPMGSTVYVYLTAGGRSLIADLDAETTATDGQTLDVVFDMNKAHLFDPETQVALI
jgi:multiple sugar transport system ATP-binding protein